MGGDGVPHPPQASNWLNINKNTQINARKRIFCLFWHLYTLVWPPTHQDTEHLSSQSFSYVPYWPEKQNVKQK